MNEQLQHPQRQQSVYMNHLGLVCALGQQHDAIRQHLQRGLPDDCSGLTVTDQFTPGKPLPLGQVTMPLTALTELAPQHQSRSNVLLLAALAPIQAAFDAMSKDLDPLRIAIVLGTSTSGIGEGEAAIGHWHESGALPANYHYRQQQMAAPAEFLAQYLSVQGPAYVISTACSSSAKALASGRRLLRLGLCDLVIAGGVDSLCALTVNGFSALDAVSEQVCQPFSASRNGINIGEGAALFILSRTPGPVALVGVGESSDAHHISAPEPSGAGAAAAMSQALKDADLAAVDIDYVNLHGTATVQNDKMESLAVASVLGTAVACSSTKPHTGHALGAAGAIEAAFCWLSLSEPGQHWPRHCWDGCVDPELAALNFVDVNTPVGDGRVAMSNSFAFGGNNISLIMERQP